MLWLSGRIRQMLLPIVFVLAAVMFLVVFAQVVFRYVLERPLVWSEELARYLMIWTACLAAAEAYARGSHVGVTVFTSLLPTSVQRWIGRLVHLVTALLMVVIFYHGYRLSYLLRDQLSTAMEIPMTWPYLAVPVGATLIFIQAAVLLVSDLTSTKPVPEKEVSR
jgi:TRAP-type C4-dicarboxylate transport system permease small subunit